jgi:hypothetical protein
MDGCHDEVKVKAERCDWMMKWRLRLKDKRLASNWTMLLGGCG